MRGVVSFRRPFRRPFSRRSRAALAGLTLVLAVAACGGAPPTGPAAVVQSALDRLAARDLDGLRTLACAGQESQIRQLLDLPTTSGTDLIPGVDTQAVIDAVRVDVSHVDIGDATIQGDAADVALSGSVKVTFDADALRPIVRQFLDAQGTTMSDEQLDALLQTFQSYGQDVPLDQAVHLVREAGDWKICQAG